MREKLLHPAISPPAFCTKAKFAKGGEAYLRDTMVQAKTQWNNVQFLPETAPCEFKDLPMICMTCCTDFTLSFGYRLLVITQTSHLKPISSPCLPGSSIHGEMIMFLVMNMNIYFYYVRK